MPTSPLTTGTARNNMFIGQATNDTYRGLGGNDVIQGYGGNDVLRGDEGNDFIDGGVGDDVVDGGPGNDYLAGTVGRDTVIGGAGDDRITAGGGDTVNGGDGNDTLTLIGLRAHYAIQRAGTVWRFTYTGPVPAAASAEWRATTIGTTTVTGVETIAFGGGIDRVAISALAPTRRAAADLASAVTRAAQDSVLGQPPRPLALGGGAGLVPDSAVGGIVGPLTGGGG